MLDVFQLMQTHSWFLLLVVGLVSLCVGSFLNVVIYRIPKMLQQQWRSECTLLLNPQISNDEKLQQTAPFNLATPSSHCPSCDAKIMPWQNIPLISWLLLRGRCSQCKTPIAMRYPLIELGTALASLFIAFHYGPIPQIALYLVLTWALIALIFIDIDHMLLPDQITLPLLWLMLLASTFDMTIPPSDAIIGAAVGYLSLWSVYWLFKLATGKEGMGYGDFKLLAVFGALLGWQAILTIVLLSSLVGAIIGSIQLAVQGKDKSTPIPFGPYLAIAGWLTLLFGDIIESWYFGLILA
ncbi:Type 4 prepilin-like proteins leader peptide-processing enzyme [Pseudoalteromonas holothuriae]|uniref:Prepilin leader peptidase/N-methyltransferase n=1 Tax=Pseudoalteromonas holothuriae TaxID=2963714 RepID=A0A9W4QWL4_9GAMM|nr:MULTISPECIES: A24 family peptidase [unclassified Pseudoalteromonas]CAH9053050.1 Type 4 prepilin-like proteins leader peptide-processing enzyme [Pseudoalteromonas sp. CIP111951]CAH9056477.1 Type 4 prepilin-like proteins leader peptide-processing enzyme [Pseudoalteromonas sp. CIP111854]